MKRQFLESLSAPFTWCSGYFSQNCWTSLNNCIVSSCCCMNSLKASKTSTIALKCPIAALYSISSRQERASAGVFFPIGLVGNNDVIPLKFRDHHLLFWSLQDLVHKCSQASMVTLYFKANPQQILSPLAYCLQDSPHLATVSIFQLNPRTHLLLKYTIEWPS